MASHRLVVTVAAALAMVAGAPPLPATPPAPFVQRVDGSVLHPAGTGAAARNAWVASNGAVNGVSGFVFEVDPRTVGRRFVVRLTSSSGFEDTNVTFYQSYEAASAVTCSN